MNKDKKKLSMFDLPIYRDYAKDFFEIISELDSLLKREVISHKKLVENAYSHSIEIFPLLNAGYNHWEIKGKLKIYNKVRFLLSELLAELSLLEEFELIKKSYLEFIDDTIKYMNSLIKKFEI